MTRFLLPILMLCAIAIEAQISISDSTTSPDQSAMLDIKSSNSGMLIPRMSTMQRMQILEPAQGLLVYDQQKGHLYQYDGGWKSVLNQTDYQEFAIFNDTILLTGSNSFLALHPLLDDLGVDTDDANEIQSLGLFNDTILLSGSNTFIALNQVLDDLGVDTDDANEIQSLGLFNDTILLSGSNTFIALNQVLDDLGVDTDDANEIQSLGLLNDTLFLSGSNTFIALNQVLDDLGVDTDDANEIQSLGLFNDTILLSGSNTFIALNQVLDDLGVDTDDANEIQSLGLFNDTILLSGSNTFIALNQVLDDLGVDTDDANEIQSLGLFNDTILLSGSNTFIALNQVLDDLGVDTDDANEIQSLGLFNDTILLSGSNTFIALNQVLDDLGVDTDDANEIQSLGLFNDTILLSGSNTFIALNQVLDDLGVDTDDANEIQTLGIFNDTLFLTGSTEFIDLGEKFTELGFDIDQNNEIQTLQVFNDTMLLSGTSSGVPFSDFNYWQRTAFNDTMMYNDGPLRLGMSDPSAIEFDQGKTLLRNSFDMLTTERSWVNIITDTDKNQTDAHFALYTDVPGTLSEAVVNFSLDNKDSWINSGDVGFGTNQPDTDLHLAHGNETGDGLKMENDPNDKHWRMFVGSEGNLALYNTTSPGTPIGGFVEESGAYVTASDLRTKKDIATAPDVLLQLQQLQTKKYHFIGEEASESMHYGFIAQEVAKIFPEIVHYDSENDRHFMDYSAFGVLAVKAIQEQQAQIDALNDRLTRLEAALEKR